MTAILPHRRSRLVAVVPGITLSVAAAGAWAGQCAPVRRGFEPPKIRPSRLEYLR
jgi:hypothetical protein